MTIKDIMASHVDPAGDFLFQSVQVITDERGTIHKAPKTYAEWAEVRQYMAVLHDAPNFMVMEGRKAARPEDRSQFPEVELQPEEIQQLLDKERPDFIGRARVLQQAAAVGLKAIDAKDKDALAQSLIGVDVACESCHLHYWYPKDQRARKLARENGIRD